MIEKNWKSARVFLSASAAALLANVFIAPSVAVAQECPGEDSGPSKTLSPRIGQEVQKLYELIQADQYQEALVGFNNLINSRGGSMNEYERATTLELRASVKVNLQDYVGARRDMEAALAANGLPPNRNNQIRYYIAQLQFQDGEYQAAIQGLNGWISLARRCNTQVDNSAWYLLGAAYTQVTPPNWSAAVTPAENAVNGLDPANPNESYFGLLNLIYNNLNENTKRAALLERMINYWPGKKEYWRQLSGLYSQTGRDQEAFSVIEVAYRAGLLSTEAELLTVVQYYSYFDNPYRGAKMLEREINAGNIRRNQDNLVLLSQLWSQAREHKRSIPILQEAAGNSQEGELSLQLGRVLLADEQYARSQRALEQAINKGRMDSKETGEAWLLLGTARFSQAGPEDVDIWASSKRAFTNAQRYPTARAQASQWISYINAVEQTFRDQKRLEEIQQRERCEADLDRIDAQRRIRDLQNRPATPEELEFEARVEAECGEDEEAVADADGGSGGGGGGQAAGGGDEDEAEAEAE